MKIGYLRQDESSHWYLVPEDEVKSFDRMADEACSAPTWEEQEDLWIDFSRKFDKYRLGGGYTDVKCVIE